MNSKWKRRRMSMKNIDHYPNEHVDCPELPGKAEVTSPSRCSDPCVSVSIAALGVPTTICNGGEERSGKHQPGLPWPADTLGPCPQWETSPSRSCSQISDAWCALGESTLHTARGSEVLLTYVWASFTFYLHRKSPTSQSNGPEIPGQCRHQGKW